jgi:Sugar (and other) transporter
LPALPPFFHGAARKPARVDAAGLHRFLCVFAGRGHLGFHQRCISESRKGQRPEPGKFVPLDHERADFLDVSADGGVFGGYPFVFFLAMMVAQFVVVLFVYPETKGISLEDMQKKLKIA